jgi:hypothetical protein
MRIISAVVRTISLTPDDQGYFMAGLDGNVYGFADARSLPAPSGVLDHRSAVAIAAT